MAVVKSMNTRNYAATAILYFRPFMMRLKNSTERLAVAVTVAISGAVCVALLLWPQGKAPGGHDEHGHSGGEEEGEHGVEGIELDDDALESSGMSLEEVKSIEIQPHISVRGQITENGNRSMNVKPRFSGIVRAVYKDFGDQVRKGDPLLLVENAATRSSYTIRTAIDGIVADKTVVSGAFIPENESVMRIVSLDSVWFRARVPVSEAEKLQVGFAAEVDDRLLGAKGKGRVLYVSPVVDEDTQACDVRVELDNSSGYWKIGSFAKADIFLAALNVKVAVNTAAIQSMNEQLVVFKKVDEEFTPVSVSLGWSDEQWTEITAGLDVGFSRPSI